MKLIAGMDKLSSVPVVYNELDEAIRNMRVSASHISSIISKDTGLTARLLRIVNSAFYSFPRKIDTISRAVIIVGTQQLRDLALATSIISSFKDIPENRITVESFWKHSIACGIAARCIAGYFKEPNIERYFVAGILHDIGRIVLVTKAPDLAEEIFRNADRTGQPLFLAERAVMGCDHGAIGSDLVRLWQLPRCYEEIIGFHHQPNQADLYKLETSVVHIADVIAHAMMLGNSGERGVPPVYEEAWKETGLSVDLLPYIMDTVEKQYHDSVNGFIFN
ncbi:MAG: HDOD domain-containing protein [Bacteroidetes bacterium]|nr:HDOD domain-containing protein [Bacteroidota bacterium]